jgi:hypothetical protein
MVGQPKVPQSLLELFERDAGLGIPEISDRDRAGSIVERIDHEQQLIAISGLLRRNKAADEQLEAERKEIIEFIKRSTGPAQERAIDESGENFYVMVYQSAAHSMAALGMLAPMYESMFYQAFQGIRTTYFGVDVVPPGHHRSALPAGDFWNCHKYCDKKTGQVSENVVAGIVQLAKAIDLKKYLPVDLPKTIEALFDYRNFMFHNGFEWPEGRCEAFAAHIEGGGWKAWFECSERSDKPRIFYMTDEFIRHCVEMVHKLLGALGAYCREHRPLETIPVERSPTV